MKHAELRRCRPTRAHRASARHTLDLGLQRVSKSANGQCLRAQNRIAELRTWRAKRRAAPASRVESGDCRRILLA